jgi:preprotein translocase subunit SecE
MATKTPTAGAVARAPAKPAPKQATPDAPRKKVSPAQFLREVRAEARKITWTSRKETWITSVMVFIMVILSSIFFWVVDFGLGSAMNLLLTRVGGA